MVTMQGDKRKSSLKLLWSHLKSAAGYWENLLCRMLRVSACVTQLLEFIPVLKSVS